MAVASGTAFVAEELDPKDQDKLSALFRAHWESADGKLWEQGPTGVSVDTAIKWARARAGTVYVTLGVDDDTYSAGEEPGSDTRGDWPPPGVDIKPRPVGVSAFGGPADVATWLVTLEVGSADKADTAAELYARHRLEQSQRITNVQVEHSGTGLRSLVFAVRARGGHKSVNRIVDLLLSSRVGEVSPVAEWAWSLRRSP